MPRSPLRFVPVPTARHLPSSRAGVAAALRARGRDVHPLLRRGAPLGAAVPLARRRPSRAEAEARWACAEPVFLPGILGRGPLRAAAAIEATLAMFDRLRRGGRFLDELEERLRGADQFVYAGSTIDRSDPREVERVFVDAEPQDGEPARDLWAKLAWIADDATDRSMRIRFSAGKEQQAEWLQVTDEVAAWSDAFARAAFPECDVVLRAAPLQELLAALLRRPFRLSERIVYNNAPGGGAVFHHDAEPGQLGVVFSQLEGSTAWLALSKRRLAAELVRAGHCRDERAAEALLDAGDDEATWRLLNRDEEFTGALAARGALFVLREGDSILLPSHGVDAVAWHSVIALGRRPSLAHSYGLFGLRPRRRSQESSEPTPA